jgi:hypothetical protein
VIAFGHGGVKRAGKLRYLVYTGCKSAVNFLYAPLKPFIPASEFVPICEIRVNPAP